MVKAAEQAGEYFDALKDSEKPRFQLVCDFQNFELLDRDTRKTDYFKLAELPNKIELFNFISGREQRVFKDQDPVNIQASELMGTIHDELEASGYRGHDLERFLVAFLNPVIFCSIIFKTAPSLMDQTQVQNWQSFFRC